jgi:hypothetical protein
LFLDSLVAVVMVNTFYTYGGRLKSPSSYY